MQGANVDLSFTPVEVAAMRIVTMMRGRIDWAGVTVLAAWLGVDDLDTLIPLIEHLDERRNAPGSGGAGESDFEE